jgi:DNA-binding Lrp family transcriptional regulator
MVASVEALRYIIGMTSKSTYQAAHVFVAGVRVFEHLHKRPPSLKDLSDVLKMSEEELSLLSRKLVDEGIVSTIVSGAECRYGVGDFAKIESLPQEGETPRMAEEISQFQNRQQSRLKELEKSLSEGGEKKKVFSDLEKALRDPSSLQKKKNPLD